MRTVVTPRRRTRLLLAAGALVLGPVLLAAPAHADTTTPTPIASEPTGGATCLPGTSASCGQDQGVSPTPTATPTRTSAPATTSPTPTASATSSDVATIPVTGGTGPTLAKTGGGAATGWGYAGTGLLLGGSVLVLVGRRPRRAAR